MEIQRNISLKPFTTFQVEASAEAYIRFDAVDEILGFLADGLLKGRRRLVLGGGSNLLFLNNFEGLILHPAMKGISVVGEDADDVLVSAAAGETWDDLVAFVVGHGWGGLENLSGIPGHVGASVIQNIGAYGIEAGDAVAAVEAVSLDDRQQVTFSPNDCDFGYRFSRFKGEWHDRFIITAVVFRLSRRPDCVLHYPGLREAAACMGDVTPANIRQAVIDIRKRKLPDPAVIPNAGSFFKNPVVSGTVIEEMRDRFPDMPFYSQSDGAFKLPAGWLIEQCGWRGRTFGNAAVHGDHALVLVNSGGAGGREIYDLSEGIRASVAERFGISLEREVVVVA
ncbi:UDP-N-acetylenolpyruvoylglucosamine reductase [Desulfococcus multivorans DSM 2059]|jgi:UDP-N-acetylmuramate dehydrogenase|uniref:UDP-N-acetylenolpyruvoylglucosamine reductase n=1 Tax=Desulfococcus multivorans DSM 2059 TaxID=1121405 RepID=S7TUT1_DESML|nr:MurB: UDP-N-acetylmuramate dehydrogenase [Desulfococcus multivorans]EPR40756.1 UDP-N-acetylenolpyruvoylglucosamine reductase [Desulfococcus multivorans DSM 2059]SJZ88840.1 UDP-N-acetylmuramate dehydrogenase [Desulfococcus multivorans DSM 2059]